MPQIILKVKKPRKPRTALEGIGWVEAQGPGGEMMLRCRRCDQLIPVMQWWNHGEGMPLPCNPQATA